PAPTPRSSWRRASWSTCVAASPGSRRTPRRCCGSAAGRRLHPTSPTSPTSPSMPARGRAPRAGRAPPTAARATGPTARPTRTTAPRRTRRPRAAPRRVPQLPRPGDSRDAPPGAVAPPDGETDDRDRRDRRTAALAHLRASGLPDPGGALPRHHPAAAGRGGAAHRDPSLEHPDPRGRRRHHRHRGARVRARRPARLRDRGRLRPRAQGREAARRAGGADLRPAAHPWGRGGDAGPRPTFGRRRAQCNAHGRTRRPRGPRPAAGHGDHDDLADRGLIPPGPDAPWATAPCARGDPRVDWTSQPGGVHVAGTGVPALEGLRPDGRTAQRAVARRLDAPFAVVGPAPRPFAAVLL